MNKKVFNYKLFAFLSIFLLCVSVLFVRQIFEQSSEERENSQLLNFFHKNALLQLYFDNVTFGISSSSSNATSIFISDFSSVLKVTTYNENFVEINNSQFLKTDFFIYFDQIIIFEITFVNYNVTISDNVIITCSNNSIHELERNYTLSSNIQPFSEFFQTINANKLFYSSFLLERTLLVKLLSEVSK